MILDNVKLHQVLPMTFFIKKCGYILLPLLIWFYYPIYNEEVVCLILFLKTYLKVFDIIF